MTLRDDATRTQATTSKAIGGPLVVPLIEQGDREKERTETYASAFVQRFREKMPGSVVGPVMFLAQERPSLPWTIRDQEGADLQEWLRREHQHILLVPWSVRETAEALLQAVYADLETVARARVDYACLPLPAVHVDGISARTPLGGLASVHTQLGPLVRQFPGWHSDYSYFSTTSSRVVLLLTHEGAQRQSSNTVASAQSRALLARALQVQPMPGDASSFSRPGAATPSERDAGIFLSYLVNLLWAISYTAFRTPGAEE